MHVLVVDDEPSFAGLLGRAMGSTHFLRVAGDCATASARLLERRFDAMVLDLRLPDGDGLSVFRLARRLEFPPPVVIHTGYPTPESTLEAGRLGACAVLVKPCPAAKLAAVLQTVASANRMPSLSPGRGLQTLLESSTAKGRSDAAGQIARVLLASARQHCPLDAFRTIAAQVRILAHTQTSADEPDAIRIPQTDTTPHAPHAARVLDVIAISTHHDPGSIASACDMSRRELADLLMASTRFDIRNWIRLARLKRAVAELLLTHKTIAECAYEAGYPKPQQLNRDSLHVLGLRPGRIREMAKHICE